MAGYMEILRTPGVARIISAQLTARVPSGMLSLAILLHVEGMHHSYGAAGLVLAAVSIGQAIAGPFTSRWMVSWGMRKVLILTVIVCTAAIITLALFPMATPWQMLVGFVLGISTPPVQSAVRTIYPKLVSSRHLTPLFSIDASAQEIIWVAGPVASTFLAIQISTTTAMLVAGFFMVAGGAWFIASPELGRVKIPMPKKGVGAVMLKPTVLVSTIVGFLLVGSFAAVEAAVVSVYGDGSAESGIVLAIWAVGSLIGGLALGKVAIQPWSLARRITIVLAGMALALISTNFWWLSIVLLVSGIGVAPTLAVMYTSVSSSVRFSETAEAYGWFGTGQLIGAAVGSAIAGFLIDHFGSFGGFAISTGLALLGLFVSMIFRKAMPDLRGRDAGPIPDTEPIRTIT